jgi:hypothetical protein
MNTFRPVRWPHDGRWLMIMLLAMCLSGPGAVLLAGPVQASSEPVGDHLKRARVFLAAGDYRRAVEACQRQVEAAPSAESYVYLTYVYHAIDGYLESLSKADRWVAVGQLYLNFATRDAGDLADPPDVLTRIAKEVIQSSVRQQSDVTATMATRLDRATTERLWKQQTAWREARPDSWWAGVPEGWRW